MLRTISLMEVAVCSAIGKLPCGEVGSREVAALERGRLLAALNLIFSDEAVWRPKLRECLRQPIRPTTRTWECRMARAWPAILAVPVRGGRAQRAQRSLSKLPDKPWSFRFSG